MQVARKTTNYFFVLLSLLLAIKSVLPCKPGDTPKYHKKPWLTIFSNCFSLPSSYKEEHNLKSECGFVGISEKDTTTKDDTTHMHKLFKTQR